MATHLFNYSFAYTKTQASTLQIHSLIIIQLPEINEKLVNILLWYSDSIVLYFNLNLWIILIILLFSQVHTFNLLFNFVGFKESWSYYNSFFRLREFDSIWQKVEQALHISSAVSINILKHFNYLLLRFKLLTEKNTIWILYFHIIFLLDYKIFLVRDEFYRIIRFLNEINKVKIFVIKFEIQWVHFSEIK